MRMGNLEPQGKKIRIHYHLHVGYTRFVWVTPEDWEREAPAMKEKGELKLGILCFYPSFLETSTFKLS